MPTIKMAAADLSADDLRSALSTLLTDELTPTGTDSPADYPWIPDIYPLKSQFVYCLGGKTYQRGYTVGADDKVQLAGDPVEVQRRTTYEPVQMSAEIRFSAVGLGDTAVWSGTLFEAGSYPDKGIRDITEEDLDRYIANSVGSGWKIEHTSTPFDKALQGFGIQKLWREGTELKGEVTAPGWMAAALGEDVKRVSVGLTPDLSRIEELSIVNYPRVAKAALFSALTTFAGQRHSASDLKDIQSIHDLAVAQGATCSATQMSGNPPAPVPAQDLKPMRITKDTLKALFGKVDAATRQELGITEADLEAVTFAEPQAAPVHPDIQRQLDAMAAQNAALINGRIDDAARRFADDQVLAKKIVPAQRDSTATLFRTALQADSAGAGVKFNDSGALEEGANVAALRKHFADSPGHQLFNEHVENGGAGGSLTDEKRVAYFGETAEGRKVLEMTSGGNK